MKAILNLNAVVAAVVLSAAGSASAITTYDFTTVNKTETINGAIFTNTDDKSTGTGVIQSFVRVQAQRGTAEGYNTDARPLLYDENSSPQFTRDLGLQYVPIVTRDGVEYREFLLDINQNGTDPLLSLDELQIRLANSGGLTGTWGTFGTEIWDLDSGSDRSILLNYNLNPGSGGGDLFVYIPNALFVGGSYVYLYSKFGELGGIYEENDGFEEWAVRTVETVPSIPEPSTYALMFAGLAAVGFMARRRRQA
jgi:hypothetical protein